MLQTLFVISAVLSVGIIAIGKGKVRGEIITFGGVAGLISWIICLYLYGILGLLLCVVVQALAMKMLQKLFLNKGQ